VCGVVNMLYTIMNIAEILSGKEQEAA